MIKIDSKIPEGPVAEKWTNYKAHQKLVNPAINVVWTSSLWVQVWQVLLPLLHSVKWVSEYSISVFRKIGRASCRERV